jgi:Acetyltransferase (GNAT) family
LVLQVIRNQLARVGIEFTPYYWVQEGLNLTEIPEIKGMISEYSVEFLDNEDMKIIGENARGYSEEIFLSRLRNGLLCLGLKHLDNIASFMWINFNECNFEPISMPLERGEAYLTDMYTMESYRGKNLAAYLRYRSYEILNKMGRDKIFSVVEYFNTSAMKYKQKLNPKKLKLVLFIRFFHKLKWSYTIKTY